MQKAGKAILTFLYLVLSFQSPLHAQTSDEAIAAIRNVFQTTQPNMVIEAIVPSPVDGMFEVTLFNGQTIYVTGDARFLIPGDMYEALPEGLVNRSEEIIDCDEQIFVFCRTSKVKRHSHSFPL